MTSPAPYALFLQVASCDARVAHLKQLAISITKQRDLKQTEIAQHLAKLELLSTSPRQLKKSIDDFELEIRSITEKLKPKLRQLELLTSEKQTLALSHEIALLRAQKEALAEQQMEQWLDYEAMREQHEKNQPLQEQWQQKAHTELQALNEQLEQTETSLANAHREHAKITALLSETWQQQYNRMKSHMPDPIVHVQNASCGGCFYPLESLVLVKTKRLEITTCSMCHRFLVYQAAPAEPLNPG